MDIDAGSVGYELPCPEVATSFRASQSRQTGNWTALTPLHASNSCAREGGTASGPDFYRPGRRYRALRRERPRIVLMPKVLVTKISRSCLGDSVDAGRGFCPTGEV